MARKLVVEVVGDTRQFERSMKRSSVAAGRFERDMSQMGRGVAAGSGLFRSLGRSVAFASGGFIAFAGVTDFLKDSIVAAREAAAAQRSLAAQMKAAGQSFSLNQGRIEDLARSYAKFGFDNDEVIQSLTVLERGTGSIDKAMKLQTLTADIARAKNIRLADAASVVAKVFGGQETALRRAVPGLAKNAHGMDLIAAASRKMAGQAAANTTEAERFHAALHNTEEIIGTALLPVVDKYLKKLGDWLSDEKNQKRLQKDVNTIVSDGATAFNDLAKAFGAVKSAWDKLPDWGGTKSKGLIDLLREIPGGNVSLLDLFGVDLAPKKATGDLWKGIADSVTKAADGIVAAVQKAKKAGAGGGVPLSLAGRFNLAELRLAQAQLTKTLADDRRILVVEKAIVEQQIASTKNLQEKIKFTRQLADINSQILQIDQQGVEAAKERAQALKDQADAIKQAVLDRLQGKQQDLQDKAAIQDAKQQLRTARLLGGPVGIKLATRALTDAQLQAQIDRRQRAPATLTGAGRFTLGNVTVNVNGVTDPDKVAKAVVAAIRRGNTHNTHQSRGAGAPH